MRRFRIRRPSPAFVLALLALIVAFTGSAWAEGPRAEIAAALSGKSIKRGSLPANRIRRDSIGAGQVNEAKLFANGLTHVDYVVASAPIAPAPGPFRQTATATCPPGDVVIGGGTILGNRRELELEGSYPGDRTSWSGEVSNLGDQASTFTVAAICIRARATNG